MLLKEKNNMKNVFYLSLLSLVLITCKAEPKELTPEEIKQRDSISKTEQSRKVDSMKRKNPLLIAPPDSQYTGDYVDKYPGGVIKFKGFFRFGQRHGAWLSFYPNGIIWSEMHYDKGLRHGPNITYYESGKKRYEGFYKNDLQDSVWIYYDTSGVEAERFLYREDRIIRKLQANEGGDLKKEKKK